MSVVIITVLTRRGKKEMEQRRRTKIRFNNFTTFPVNCQRIFHISFDFFAKNEQFFLEHYDGAIFMLFSARKMDNLSAFSQRFKELLRLFAAAVIVLKEYVVEQKRIAFPSVTQKP